MGRKAITTGDNEESKRQLNPAQPLCDPSQCYGRRPLSSMSYYGMSSDPPPKKPQMAAEEAAGQLREQTIRIANAALAYYNRKYSTHYELVDPISSNGRLWSGIWYHCNFTAKRDGDSSMKLFFAEMKVAGVNRGMKKYLVTACRVLNGAKTITGCELCRNCISHPTRGFRQGLYQSQPRALRPRSAGKVVKN